MWFYFSFVLCKNTRDICFSCLYPYFDNCFRELVAELPFTLMHPKPESDPDRPSSSSGSHKSGSEVSNSTKENGGGTEAGGGNGGNGTNAPTAPGAAATGPAQGQEGGPLVDTNLIQLDT